MGYRREAERASWIVWDTTSAGRSGGGVFLIVGALLMAVESQRLWSHRYAEQWIKGANKAPGIHGASSKLPREEPRNKRRDILRMRAEFYDNRMAIEAVVERWQAVGYEESFILDILFYRQYQSLWFLRESDCACD